jgi:hypothetical protein
MMNGITWGVGLLAGGMLVLLGVLLVYAIAANLAGGMRYRRTLESRIRQVRLHRMIERLGVGLEHYLHQQTVAEIERHIRLCSECPVTVTCDARLAEVGPVAALEFCPTAAALASSRPLD